MLAGLTHETMIFIVAHDHIYYQLILDVLIVSEPTNMYFVYNRSRLHVPYFLVLYEATFLLWWLSALSHNVCVQFLLGLVFSILPAAKIFQICWFEYWIKC